MACAQKRAKFGLTTDPCNKVHSYRRRPRLRLAGYHSKAAKTETFFQGIVPQFRLFDPRRHEYPNLPAYLIFDAQYLKEYSFANRPVGAEVQSAVSRAGTLPELAAKLGIDGAELAKTVRRFNGFVEGSADEDFHRGEHQWKLASPTAARGGDGTLGTVEEPPFYGIELHPAGGSSVGLLTDAHAQVIHQRRRPIPGLYASGNAAAATEQGVGYQAGASLASAMTFSYLAIRHMLGAADSSPASYFPTR
jgi:3-oxosteroid 1-dehydrogenase